MDDKKNTLALLFLMLKDKLNGYNCEVLKDFAYFDFEYNGYFFTLRLQNDNIQLSRFVEVAEGEDAGELKEIKEVFDTDFSILEILAKF